MSQDEIAALVDRFAAAPGRIERAAAGVETDRLRPDHRPLVSGQPATSWLTCAPPTTSCRRDWSRSWCATGRRCPPTTSAAGPRRWATPSATSTTCCGSIPGAGLSFQHVCHLAAEDWQREGIHEERGPRTILRLLRILVDHEQEHCAQIESLLA